MKKLKQHLSTVGSILVGLAVILIFTLVVNAISPEPIKSFEITFTPIATLMIIIGLICWVVGE